MTRSNLLSPVVSYFVVNCFSCGAIDAGAVMTLVLVFRGLYVGHNRKPCKTDEQIETPFGVWNRLIGPKKPCIFEGGGEDPTKMGTVAGSYYFGHVRNYPRPIF